MQVRVLNWVTQAVSVLAVLWFLVLSLQDEATPGWLALALATVLASIGTQLLVFQQEKRDRPPQ